MSDERYVLPGVFHVTGDHGVGKTLFALGCGANPERICFVDDDVKGRSTKDELERQGVSFGEYVNLAEIGGSGTTEYDFHVAAMKIIQGFKKSQFDVLVWDTWTRFASSFHSFVAANERLFRKEWAPMGKIKGAQQWKVAREFEAQTISILNQKIPTIFLVSHLKSYYLNGVAVPGKSIPDVSSSIERVCRARFWIRRNPSGRAVPVALVMKSLDVPRVVPGKGIVPTNVLPQKLVPRENEHSLWDVIWRYWNEPMGDREPTAEELPDEYELSIIGNTLSADQRHILEKMLDAGIASAEEETAISASIGTTAGQRERIVELHSNGMALPLIAKELGISPGIVSTVLSMSDTDEIEL